MVAMPNDQIQKLTDALYEQGVEKGEKKAAQIIEQSQKEASAIIEKAKKEAQGIIDEAHAEAQNVKSRSETETRIAAREIIHEFHHKVVEMILLKVIDEPLKDGFSETGQMTQWVSKIMENWQSDQDAQPGLDILLPEKEMDLFNQWYEKEASKVLKDKARIRFSDSIDGGFEIIPQDGTYKIDLTVEAFQELFRDYLKTRTRKLLFGQ